MTTGTSDITKAELGSLLHKRPESPSVCDPSQSLGSSNYWDPQTQNRLRKAGTFWGPDRGYSKWSNDTKESGVSVFLTLGTGD